jgi:hypothetical protein
MPMIAGWSLAVLLAVEEEGDNGASRYGQLYG